MPKPRPFAARAAVAVALLWILAACSHEIAHEGPPIAVPSERQLTALADADLFVSEYVEGSGFDKALEIFNGTGAAIDLAAGAYEVQVFSNGATDPNQRIALEGTLAAGDVYVVANAQAGSAIAAEADLTSGGVTWNGDDAVALVKGGVFLDVVGRIGVDPGSAWTGGDASTQDSTLRRKPTVCAGDPDGSDPFDPSFAWAAFPVNTFDGLGSHVADCDGAGGGDGDGAGEGGADTSEAGAIGVCGEAATRIHEIQGSGPDSPLVGRTVVIEGVVIGDFQRSDQLRGFFVQEEDADADGDPATSEGLFVFSPTGPDVQTGDVVRIEGDVDEYFGSTQLTNVTVFACASDAPLPTATEIAFPLSSVSDLEAFENMRVSFPQALVIAEYFEFGRYGEIVLADPIDGLDRPYQPTSYLPPGPDAQAASTEIQRDRIVLDDGLGVQNPSYLRHPNGEAFGLDNRFRGGDTVTNATGVLSFSFGEYKIQPTEGADHEATNPRSSAPEPVGGNVTVATMNVLNYFRTLRASGRVCGPLASQDCRGADDASEFTRQRDKIFAALEGLDADVVGIVEIENDADDAALNDLVDGLNGHLGSEVYTAIETGPIGGDAIRVALVYKPGTVTPIGEYAVLDTPAFLDPNATGDERNRAALAQAFRPAAGGEAVTIVVNHLKSKGSPCGAGDDDPVQGNCNLTRTLATESLLAWVATDPTGSGSPHALLIGDLNAYDEEDPIGVLLAGGYVDLLENEVGEDAYTYVFDGQFGHLDYAFANAELADRVTGATAWAINADEPNVFDYDLTFKPAAQVALYEPNVYRSSDHDPVLVGLDLASSNRAPVCDRAEASVGRLWPANHRLVAGTVVGVTDPDGDAVVIAIDGIFQDEPANARGDGGTVPDAVIGHGNAFEVRAERDARGNGRVYHVAFTASDGVASCSGTVRIGVDRNQDRNGGAVDDGPLYDATRP